MEADDNGSEESASVATPVEPLDDMAPLQQALEDNATEKTKPRHAIVRLWNKEDVDRITGESTETITVHVTPTGEFCSCWRKRTSERLIVNKSLLCHFSAYFRALFFGGFAKSIQEEFSFDIQPHDAHIFEVWLRCGLLHADIRENKQPCFGTLLRLYTFADYYDIPALRRAIMLEFASPEIKDYTTYPNFNGVTMRELKYRLSGLPTTSPFYRWLLERYANCSRRGVPRARVLASEGLNTTFRQSRNLVLEVMVDNRDSRQCRCCHNPCDYHEHESEEEWERTCYLVNENVPKPDPTTYRKPSRAP